MVQVVVLYLASIAYAIVRYVVFAPENLESLPVFIVNKGVAMAAALSLAFGFLQALRRARGVAVAVAPSTWFRAGVFGAIWHVPMALAILEPSYFKEFFAEPNDAGLRRLSFAGELVFMFGGIALALVYLLVKRHWTPRARWWLSLAGMVALLAHVLSMGYCRGLNFKASHGYLPAMWLLSAIGIALSLWWLVRSRAHAFAADPGSRDERP